jgi:hypothetical protein
VHAVDAPPGGSSRFGFVRGGVRCDPREPSISTAVVAREFRALTHTFVAMAGSRRFAQGEVVSREPVASNCDAARLFNSVEEPLE